MAKTNPAPQVNRREIDLEAELLQCIEQKEIMEALANKYNQEVVNRDLQVVKLERKIKNLVTQVSNLQTQLEAYKNKNGGTNFDAN